ncbi:hypothetical protein DZG00_11050 [Clavibacter lycopersici]|uniref:Uncharacterized protein n=1 Tax=Clavibacter lycopersici TaxID=2301718 RepID=A0A399T6C1_9MICO|nr:hypothetical protein [Clavibacter lycopersici]RIJ50342.1 hypothetical protein DZG00_11050 [Clavibacter lycopersici]RIJ59932.1 hypothetical protein DZG02_10920 [Clavibacter lycopersici]
MTSADASGTSGEGDRDEAAAAEVLEALLDAGPRRPVRRAVRAIGTVALTAVGLGGDLGGLGREAQLVVRRIDTGREVLRTDAGDLDEADRLLQRVRLDLETRSVRDFVAEWRLVDADPGSGSGSSTGAAGA